MGNLVMDRRPAFIDLFAGCGGLSLGLMTAGWRGLFGVECHADAFRTLQHNLLPDVALDGRPRYEWPAWLEKQAWFVSDLIAKHTTELIGMRGQVDAVVGGPPCQGFSTAGKRKKKDARNQLYLEYLKLVELVQPRIVLLENVKGITIAFPSGRGKSKPTSDQIVTGLDEIGYASFPRQLCSSDFGIAQRRSRFFLVGVRKDALAGDPYQLLEEVRADLLKTHGLELGEEVGVATALSDLQTEGVELMDSPESKRFQQIVYSGPLTPYQRVLNCDIKTPDGLRLPRHTKEVIRRNKRMLKTVRRGVSLNDKERARFGLSKVHLVILDPAKPAPTLTTLPDDLIHYSEPRILTVREYARLQSFPDWYSFMGPYTTGGARRKVACPKYTQVGNAVSPRVAECVGRMLGAYLAAGVPNECTQSNPASSTPATAQDLVSA